MMIVLTLVALVLSVAFYALKQHYQFWKKRGILGPKPTFLVGNLGNTFLLKESPGELYCRIYNEYPNSDIVGVYRAFVPALLIRDPELIKDITTKYFSHFHDNDMDIDKNVDPLFGRNPFVLKGEEWKTVRAQLTPAFTSGRMKSLYTLLDDIGKNLVKFIENQPQALDGAGYEAKELCTKFTLNNVASCAFGLEGKCFEEENNEFRQLANDFFSPSLWSTFLMFVLVVFPSTSKYVTIKTTKKVVEDKLIDIVTKTLQYRKENNIIRNDFLHMMSQLKETCKDYDFSDIDVTAHAASFLADGYETSSVVMSFLLFYLASNPDAQTKLREEIMEITEKNNGQFSYEALQSTPYLDGVINETIRMTPPAFILQKLCTKDFTFTPKNSTKPITIKAKTPIIVPLLGLQNDPNLFDNPETFKPERFIGDNKNNIIKCSFLPFGEGPRACLGQRFGILQIKVGVVYVIKNYVLSVNKKTKLPIKFDPGYFLTSPIGGLWLDFKKVLP